MDFQALDALAAQLMKDRKAHGRREPGFIYYHGRRTARGVIALRKQLTQNDDHDDILRAAAMFHDIAKGLEPHWENGAHLAERILTPYVTPGELEEITRLIRVHDDRRPQAHDFWVSLLQDADLLDHFGTVEIWMSIQYYAHTGDSMDELAPYYDGPFVKNAAVHREELNFDLSKTLFDEKYRFLQDFSRRVAVEAQGEYWPLRDSIN